MLGEMLTSTVSTDDSSFETCSTQVSQPHSGSSGSDKINCENETENSSDPEILFSKQLSKNIVSASNENLYGFVSDSNIMCQVCTR